MLEIDPTPLVEFAKRIGITVLIDSGIEIRGRRFWGSPVTLEHGDMAFNRQPGAEISRHWAQIPQATEILITHGPPFGILDQAFPADGSPHLGCRDLRAKVETLKPKVHIFGHIHGGHGHHTDKTDFYNVAICTEEFKATNPVTVITI